jgi:catechol 2,3-dioxygenase-like lactoylglutathione lyase family enzyme
MSAPVEVRRLLHTNYNCHDPEVLERWYTELFGTRAVMRARADDSDGIAFGLRMPTAYDATFLYDHRGARRTSSLELVRWRKPPTIGHPYADPWDRGIQSVAYTVPDLDYVAQSASRLGGTVVRRGEDWLLLRDPEGVWVEVYPARGEPEQIHVRVTVDDLSISMAWWCRLGWATGAEPRVFGAVLWPATKVNGVERQVVAEQALTATDDSTLSVLLTRWSGNAPAGPSYGAPFHNGLYRFAMAVDDVQEAYQRLLSDRVACQPPYTFLLPGTAISDGLTILFLRDPDDILVELVHRPRSFFKNG